MSSDDDEEDEEEEHDQGCTTLVIDSDSEIEESHYHLSIGIGNLLNEMRSEESSSTVQEEELQDTQSLLMNLQDVSSTRSPQIDRHYDNTFRLFTEVHQTLDTQILESYDSNSLLVTTCQTTLLIESQSSQLQVLPTSPPQLYYDQSNWTQKMQQQEKRKRREEEETTDLEDCVIKEALEPVAKKIKTPNKKKKKKKSKEYGTSQSSSSSPMNYMFALSADDMKNLTALSMKSTLSLMNMDLSLDGLKDDHEHLNYEEEEEEEEKKTNKVNVEIQQLPSNTTTVIPEQTIEVEIPQIKSINNNNNNQREICTNIFTKNQSNMSVHKQTSIVDLTEEEEEEDEKEQMCDHSSQQEEEEQQQQRITPYQIRSPSNSNNTLTSTTFFSSNRGKTSSSLLPFSRPRRTDTYSQQQEMVSRLLRSQQDSSEQVDFIIID